MLLLFVIFLFVGRATGNVSFVFDHSLMWVITESMEPEIPAQSYILIKRATPSAIIPGDVIVFRSSDPLLKGALNTHRVMEVLDDGKSFVTKGDNNLIADKHTALAENVIGVYQDKLPILSAIIRFVMSPLGMVVFGLIIGITVLLTYLPAIIKKQK